MVSGGGTVTGTVAEAPAFVIVMLAEPGPTAVTRPMESTVATAGVSEG